VTTLQVHRTTTDTELDNLLAPASADGDEFTAPPGTVILFAANKLKRRGRRGLLTVNLRVERHGGTDDLTATLKPDMTYSFGPFGITMGRDGFELGTYDPVTVKLTYPGTRGPRGLKVCVVETPHCYP